MLSVFFRREDLVELLSQPGSMGLRIYPALDNNGYFSLLAIAIDNNRADMTHTSFVVEGNGGATRLTVQQAMGMLGEVQRVMAQAAQEGRGASTPLYTESGAEGALYSKAAFKSADLNIFLDSGAAGIRFFSTRIILKAGNFSTLAAVAVDAAGQESDLALVSTLPCPPDCAGGGYLTSGSRTT